MSLIVPEEIDYLRQQFNFTVKQVGVLFQYRYPLNNKIDYFNQPAPDGYSERMPIYGIFEGEPKLKTYRNLGWVVEKNDNLPFLIHVPFDVPHIQRGCLFEIDGQITAIKSRLFQVTELSTGLVCPDHIICQIVPLVGNSRPLTEETERDLNRKNSEPRRFLKNQTDS